MFLYQSADQIQVRKTCFDRKITVAKVLQMILVGIWVYLLRGTDAYYSVYLFCAAAAVFCVWKNVCGVFSFSWKKNLVFWIFAVWFSSTTVLANYRLFITKPLLERLLSAGFAFLGGTLAGYHVIQFAAVRIPVQRRQENDKISSRSVFLTSFCLMEGIFLIHLMGSAYPGYFTPDVFNSIHQIVEGVYVNNNPFWYTMSIKLIAGIGYGFFGNANAAMAFYVFWQGLIMAAVFSYVVVTLYQIGAPQWVVIGAGLMYGLLPYNIVYSSTMLKDIPFSVSSLLFVVSLYRILRDVGNSKRLNYVFFFVGAFIFCLMRTNGLASFFVTALVVLTLLKKTQKKVLLILVVAILVLSWILTNPVLDILQVGGTDFVEGLAVPFQQIARVITMGYELEPYEYEMLNKVFDVDMIPDVFTHGCVDPIKRAAFRDDGRVHLKENLNDYVSIWLQMGKKYPGEYLKAWIELTKGYWNGGYEYWAYYLGGANERYGIIRPDSMPMQGFFGTYFSAVESLALSKPFYSIGLHVWILFGCLALNIKEKRTELVLAIPGLIILLGLWLGTPVYSEFRYAYPMILSIPLVLGTTLCHKN